MKRISKQQQADIDQKIGACEEARSNLEEAIDAYNQAVGPLRDQVQGALNAYNESLTDLKGVYEEIGGEAREYFDERSERWQEGEVGQAYGEWADQLEAFEVDEATLEIPGDLEMPNEIPDFSDLDVPPDEPG